MSLTGEADGGPVKTGAHIFDYGSGFAAALGIVTALYQRHATGRGQNVDVSMLETALVMNGDTVSDVLNAGARPMRHGNRAEATGSINNVFPCKDGTWLLIAASREPQRQRLWPAIGRPDIAQDARFATPEARIGHMDALYSEIETALQAKTAREWEDILADAAIGSSEVKTVGDALEHPHVQARQPFHDLGVVPGLGVPIKVPLAPYRLSEGRAQVHSAPPRPGQHTDEILVGLGYDAAGIARLREAGVV
jgi:formyl-CoA transferase